MVNDGTRLIADEYDRLARLLDTNVDPHSGTRRFCGISQTYVTWPALAFPISVQSFDDDRDVKGLSAILGPRLCREDKREKA